MVRAARQLALAAALFAAVAVADSPPTLIHAGKLVDVVGEAEDGREALQKIAELKPDLLTLDIEMPEMNGLELLRELSRRRLPTGAIMFSSLTRAGAENGFAVTIVEPVSSPGSEIYSSTQIRDHLRAGRPAEAAALLGRPFEFEGRVRHGDALGRVGGAHGGSRLPGRGACLRLLRLRAGQRVASAGGGLHRVRAVARITGRSPRP